MYEFEALELSATLAENNPLVATAQSRIEESIIMAIYFLMIERTSQMAIGTAVLFIDLGGPLSFI